MKILIVKNRYRKTIDWKKGIKYFTDNTPLKLEFEEMKTDFDFTFRSVSNGTGTAGVVIGGDYYDKLRSVIPPGKYQVVCVVYGNDVTVVDGQKGNGIRVSISENAPLYPDTNVIQVCMPTDNGMTFNHEFFHTLFRKLSVRGIILDDPMDKVVIDGKTEYYFNNKSLTANPSNRTIALDRLKPYWNFLMMTTPIVPKVPTYQYFKPSEIVGLKPVLVEMLDKARGLAGVPFIITSGFRTVEHNESVGGVEGSSHTTGLAVDLLVKDSVTGGKILLALAQAGFKRFGFYKDGHIHVDCDNTKPTPCYWIT